MSSIASLDAAAAARKERLAQLKSLKRKQPTSADGTDPSSAVSPTTDDQSLTSTKPSSPPSPPPPTNNTNALLSGRNYDVESRAPKMGFAQAPSEGQETLEDAARVIAEKTKALQVEEEKSDKPIDLFNLQPKKPNWDLKRDVDKKLERLNVKTDSAIAKMVRQKIEETRQKKSDENIDVEMEEGAGVEGNLAALVQEREKESKDENMEDDEEEEP